jgi:protein-tyrosine phosphatase
MKVLMVCLGNICRSPLAEGILKHKCKMHGLNWQVESAGTGKWNTGSPPDPRSILIAKQHVIDISAQKARSFNSSDYENFDLIFAMDIPVRKMLMSWALDQEEENKIKLIMDEVHPGENIGVPDPYFNSSGFETVYSMLNQACDKIIENYG